MNLIYILPSLKKCAPNDVAVSIIRSHILALNNVCIYIFDNTIDYELNCNINIINLGDKIFNIEKAIIHSMGFRPDLFVFKSVLLGYFRRSKCITTLHSNIDIDIIDIYGFIIGSFYSLIWFFALIFIKNKVFLNSCQYNRFKFLNLFGNSRIICNGINFTPFARIVNYNSNFNFRVVYIGSLRKIKGVDLLINAISVDQNFILDIYGDGDQYNNLLHLTENLNLSDRVFFHGFIENPIKDLKNVNLLVVPSRSEGFGMIILEAVNYGIPVLCSDIDTFTSLFGNTGLFFFNDGSIESLAKKLLDIKYNYNFLVDKIDFKSIKDKYSEINMVDNYLNYYKFIINN